LPDVAVPTSRKTAAVATILALLSRGKDNAPAIGAPNREPLMYAGLRALCVRTAELLTRAGIGRDDRVAIVLPNGPEAATAFVSVAASAVAAPLNPAYRAEEFEFYLTDLGARALILLAGQDSPARTAAASCGVQVLDLTAGTAAGDFTLAVPETTASEAMSPALTRDPQPEDVALLLHTSGTTAKPKLVPLRQSNIVVSAGNIARSLALGPDDVCLNIMPLFHIHGLIAAVMASLSAGGCVVCSPGLNAFRLFTWFDQVKPTWYTAVPTMHQTLLELAPRYAEVLGRGRLRLIRSSSASLPAPVMLALETAFGVPVIESYGMTEATHQMASNPLPPLPRFPGSVGIAAGPQIAIMDTNGALLPTGAAGEVVIRGDNVTAGYEKNVEANAKGFTDGWFRTGDEGVLDGDGYLRLTGRLKEMINRAGEKVSPLEVDEALLRHPDVQQAATFAMPSKLFGEDVAAAVVLREGAAVDAEALRHFVADQLTAFKVPRRIVVVDEIPKGPTGKLQRIGLAAQLNVSE
jgi:acyl-CoA synthetase (AMP-forming)/AMP-acid ligase II